MVEFNPGAGEPWVQLDGAREKLDRFLDAFGRQLLDLLTAEEVKFVSSQVVWPLSTRQPAFGSYNKPRTTTEPIGDELGDFGLHSEHVLDRPLPSLGPEVGS